MASNTCARRALLARTKYNASNVANLYLRFTARPYASNASRLRKKRASNATQYLLCFAILSLWPKVDEPKDRLLRGKKEQIIKRITIRNAYAFACAHVHPLAYACALVGIGMANAYACARLPRARPRTPMPSTWGMGHRPSTYRGHALRSLKRGHRASPWGKAGKGKRASVCNGAWRAHSQCKANRHTTQRRATWARLATSHKRTRS